MGHDLLGPTLPGSVSPMIKSSESDLKSDPFDSSVGRLRGFKGQSLEVVLRCVAEPHLHIFVCILVAPLAWSQPVMNSHRHHRHALWSY